ncbi:sodium channel protein Nach-like [Trichoplusia ni]|uniref:Sodium channel protein Nach-like n=1 Tax=Trichoplusia ni TaxID=7111 RepID=A0A7E5WHI7_TRINI|nr:sodium channel protein Nach-like [Trichoplusia ni]
MDIMKHHFFTMDTIMEEIHQKCEDLLVFCAFNRKPRNCEGMFVLIKTYEGHCCTFNYAALNDASELPLLPPDEDFEYYDDHSDDGTEAIRYPNSITTSESGRYLIYLKEFQMTCFSVLIFRRSGLSVVLNVEPEDYPNWSTIPYYGVKVILSDPNDYPETTVLYRYITLGESVDIKVEPLVFQSDSSIRAVDPEKRECRFHDEASLAHTDRYSYETCRTECKMKNYLEKCSCVPYKYPREKTTRICELQDLNCLNNVTVHQSNDKMKCDPVCFMECWDKKYSVTSDLTPFLPINYPEEVT